MKSIHRYDYIFVILVYRNIQDLSECIESIEKTVPNHKIIVVNSYYDDTTKADAQELAFNHQCEFINVENRGYSFGNNTGIEFAYNNFKFKYVFVSNPDIIIKSFSEEPLLNECRIIAPQIIAADGKRQNPMAICENKFSEKLIYIGLKQGRNTVFKTGIILNKISKILAFIYMKLKSSKTIDIYSAHGSFVGLSYQVIRKLGPRLYDENMFLFGEEGVLAYKAKKADIKTVYTQDIVIYHKEDGSMKLGGFSVNDELKKANIYYYEHYRMK